MLPTNSISLSLTDYDNYLETLRKKLSGLPQELLGIFAEPSNTQHKSASKQANRSSIMSSQFDPVMFLDASLTEPTTKRPPLPVGDYFATVGDVKSRAWQGKKDPTKNGIAFDVPLEVQVPDALQSAIGQPKVVISDSIMLDLTEGGTIDNAPGKNRRLRLYREALNMNKPGDTFSARSMQGRPVKVKITHEVYEGEIYERIDSVTRS